MAKASFSLPTDFLLKLSKLEENTDKIVPEVLKAGGDVVLGVVKSKLNSVIDSGTRYPSRSTGELLNALGVSNVRLDKDGNYNLKIGFSEPRSDGGNNAKLASIIEYGKSGQPAKPFLKPAKSTSKKAAVGSMIAKFENEVSKL